MTKKFWLHFLGRLGVFILRFSFSLPSHASEADLYYQCSSTSASGVVVVGWCPVGSSAQLPVAAPSNVTPKDCSGTITTGGTSQNAFAASTGVHGFVIKNEDPTAGSGEPLWFSFTETASAAGAGSYSLSAPSSPSYSGAESFTAPYGLGINTNLSVVAATTGHKFSCTTW